MARTKVDLSKDDFEQKSFKTAPGGRYKVKISKESTIVGMTSGDGIKVKATIVEGKHKGVTFFDNIAITVKWKIAQILRALGYTHVTAKKLKTLQDILAALKGKELQAILREKTFEGKKQNSVTQWLPLGATDEAEDEDEEDDEDTDEDAADADDEGDEEDEDDEEDAEDDEDESDDDDEDDADESDDEDADEDEDDDESDEEDEEEDADESDEDDDDDADDEDDEPAPVKKGAKKKAAPKAQKKTARKKR